MKFLIFYVFAIILISLTVSVVYADNIPSWVKNTAGWWATDEISETEFVNAIEFLIKENIIQVVASSDSQKTDNIPSWVKNTAGWWATDEISETEFVNAIEFLIEIGIINVPHECKFEEKKFSHLTNVEKHLLCLNIDLTFIDEFTSSEHDPFVFNSFGFRDSEFSVEKPPNTYRIFLIGGSTIFGEKVNANETISAHLEKLFENQNLDLDIQIINAGIKGAWSKTETKLVKEKIINLEPDLLIVFDGWNDVTAELVKNKSWSEHAKVENWILRWKEICEIGKQNNFETIITVQPILGSSNKLLTNQEYGEKIHHSYIQSHVSLLQNYAGNLKNLESSCTNVADLTNAYDNVHLPVYTDLGHVNSLGGEIIAYEFFRLSIPIIFQESIEIQNQLLDNVNYDHLKFRSAEKIKPENNYSGKIIENRNMLNDIIDKRFWYAKLKNVDFSNINLSNVDFRSATLDNVSFNGAILKNVLFPRSDLSNIDFSNAELTNVNFSGSMIVYSDFNNAILDDIEVFGTTYYHNNFKNSEIKNTSLHRTTIVNSDFSETKFKNVTLKSSIFVSTDFSNVDFSLVKIKPGVSFSDSLFANSNFLAKISNNEIDFTSKVLHYNCKVMGLDKTITRENYNEYFHQLIEDNDICVIPGSSLSGLDLSKVDLSTVVFSHETEDSILSSPLLELRDVFSVDLSNTDLSYQDLSGKNLTRIIFHGANMSYTDLSNADLRYADLRNANLIGADLTNAKLDGAILSCLNNSVCEN